MFRIPSIKPIQTYKIESRTKGGVYYTVELWENNRLTCSCPALKECKHIKKFKEILQDEEYRKFSENVQR